MKVLRKNQLQIFAQLVVSIFLIRFVLFKTLKLDIALSDFEFLLFIVSFALIYAAGILLYGIIQQEENPTKKYIKNIDKAYYMYLGLNALGIAISFFFTNKIGNVAYLGFFIFLAALLYLYITQWRKIVLFSNIVFSFIIAYPIFVACVIDILPMIDVVNSKPIYDKLLKIVLSFAVLITFLIFIKTLILDLKFVSLDSKKNKKTLATLHGIDKGATRTSYLILLPITLLLIFITYYLKEINYLCIYLLAFVIFPLFYLLYQLNKAKKSKDFNISNNILNVIIWLTIISIVVLLFNIKNYATS